MNKIYFQNHGLSGLCGFRLTAALLLTALMAVGSATAQVRVKGNVYGGGNLADVHGSVTVNMTATSGVVEGDVYGGGALANTNTDNTTNTTDYTTAVNLTGGTIEGDVYGGGLGDATHAALVGGDVLVTLNGTKMVGYTTDETPVKRAGRVFGANNVNGTPKGHVKVLVQKTIAEDGLDADVAAVFGGGNLADYVPANTDDYAEVEINKTTGEGIRLVVGYVYGGGNAAGIEGGALVNMLDGDVRSGVYGGCDTRGTVTKDVTVNISKGTIGTEWTTPVPDPFPTVVFGGGLGQETLVIGSVTLNIGEKTGTAPNFTYSGSAVIWGDVYGGSAKGNVNAELTGEPAVLTASAGKTTGVNLYGGTIKGNLYGGGLGQKNGVGGATSDIAANVYGPVTITVQGGKAANVFGCNNVNGAPQNSVTVNINGTDAVSAPVYWAIENVYGGGNQAAYTYTGSPLAVNIAGGIIGNVFGGGLSADVSGSIAVTVTGGTVVNDVYGGGALANTNTAYWDGNKDATKYEVVSGLVVDKENPENSSSVAGYYEYNSATRSYIVTSDTKAQQDKTYFQTVTVKGNWVDGETSASASTTVTLTGGTVGNVYGGGLGYIDSSDPTKDVAAMVYGDVTVTINKEDGTGTAKIITLSESHQYVKTYKDVSDVQHTETVTGTVYKKGRVFGANNINGTPKGNVTVTVWSTTPVEGNEHEPENYEIQGVYGGGNLADYTPVGGKETSVNIHGCERTSIQYVFGGGNAASVPDTHVDIFGTFEIEAVFGGGNGNEPVYSYTQEKWVQNPGAEISSDTYVTLRAGLIHQAFGGSFEKGTINGTTHLEKAGTGGEGCELKITDVFGGGKDADVTNVNIILSECTMSGVNDPNVGQEKQKIENVYAGSYNARIFGNVTMTVRSGNYKNVFGGNYSGGFINGNITINVEETENCKPITIGNLYGGGNYAAYPGLGASITNGKIEINVKSCTSIGNIFGGSYHADVVGDTEVNINMIKGWWAGQTYTWTENNISQSKLIPDAIGTIGNVYGGGDEGRVIGNTVVNICNLTEISLVTPIDNETGKSTPPTHMVPKNNGKYDVLGANITGNVFGGGKLADVGRYHTVTNDGKTTEVFDGTNADDDTDDVRGNSTVNICTKYDEVGSDYVAVAVGASGVTIGGNVYGGGEGSDATFRCEKAMVTGSTDVRIGNSTIGGTVYGGGKIGRVEHNTEVTVGFENKATANGTYYQLSAGKYNVASLATGASLEGYYIQSGDTYILIGASEPVITGNVFGAGAGVNKNGYSALVRGNSTVTVQANAKVRKNVYGGGEIATVGKYVVVNGLPTTPDGGGTCTVTVQGNAEIGPEAAMKMYHEGVANDKPDDYGHVFGGGKGVLPYEGYAENEQPKHMNQYSELVTYNTPTEEADYFTFIKTLALSSETHVTIGDHAFVKGSVYGGSKNGYVWTNTYVTIQDDCQIGCGKNTTNRHEDDDNVWSASYVPSDGNDLECASWDYDKTSGASYDPFAKYSKTVDGKVKYYYDAGCTEANYAYGGSHIGKDGHTFYGNVFGGGSGYFPYKAGKWFPYAGQVKGNTHVTITGGHILTNVYGGNELTDVGVYDNSLNVTSGGNCYVTMTGGTLGVPRTLTQIANHPVTCYLFGAGKGDQRVFFNKRTNVGNVFVHVSDDARIYGSVFGGGEDGHVMKNVTMNIGSNTLPDVYTSDAVLSAMNLTVNGTTQDGKYPYIGTWGTSYVEGNVFGGGRGFGGDAYTAGNVGGSVKLTIDGGTMLGSIYGGGRLGSVGYGLFAADEIGYGEMRPDNTGDDGSRKTIPDFKRGYIDITINGGTIGNDYEFRYLTSSVDITGKTEEQIATARKAELEDTYHLPFTDATYDSDRGYYLLNHTKGGNVFAGGMGRRTKLDGTTPITVAADGIDWHKLGNVKSTKLTINGTPWIKGNVYGGGEFGAVRSFYTGEATNPTSVQGGNTEIIITGGTIGTVMGNSVNNGTASDGVGATNGTDASLSDDDTRYAFGSVYGGGYGTEEEATTYETDVEKFGAWVTGNTSINISGSATKVRGSVYGGGEMACVKGNTDVNVSNGEIGVGQVRGFDTSNGDKYYVLFGSWRMGNVYGAGKGSANAVSSGLVKGNTNVNIGPDAKALSDAEGRPKVFHNVYGGGAYGSVGTYTLYSQSENSEFTPEGGPKSCADGTGTATVTITGGQIGINGWDNGMVNGSGRGDVSAAGGSDPYDRLAWVKESIVTIRNSGSETPQPQIKGSVYGGGENGHNFGDATVDFYSGTIGTDASVTYENGNVYGSGCGTDRYWVDANNDKVKDESEKHHNRNSGFVMGNATVNVYGGHVLNSVYGGGSMASVGMGDANKASVNISGGTIDGSVYGGPKGDLSDGELKAHGKASEVTISGGSINGSVYGGGMAGIVEGSVKVYMTGGTIANDLYGGGALAHTNTKNLGDAYADTDEHDKTYDNIDLASTGSATTYVRLTGGTITRNAYGGALGDKASIGSGHSDVAAKVFGNIKVNLNGIEASEYAALSDAEKATYDAHASSGIEYATVKTGTSGCIVNRVFGANNINGTPKGSVVVNVFATQNKDALKTHIENKFAKLDDNLTIYTDESQVSDVKTILNNHLTAAAEFTTRSLLTTEQQAKVDAAQAVYDNSLATLAEAKSAVTDLMQILNTFRYDVNAVYGGGNEAAYDPASSVNHSPSVNIYNCELTSIETVYGGGNAARVPETHVTVFGAYEIYNVFGGGNGKDALASGAENPGADVTHDANTKLRGGRIHEAYGSSNTKGVIGGNIYLEASDDGECRLSVDKMVGAGKNADILNDVNLVTGCSSGSQTLIGGADNANVKGNINLMITSGHYNQVFGGNNRGGVVMGHIKVNVEETDCNPITIDELYGCGNEAPYSKYGYYVVTDNSNNPVLDDGRLTFQPRSKEDYDNSKNSAYVGKKYFAVKSYTGTTYEEYKETEAEGDQFTPYADPVINIISCTYIGKVFGGGLGERAVVHGSPTVNINMNKGNHAGLKATFPTAYKTKIDSGEIPNLTYIEDVKDNENNVIGISCRIADALGKVRDVFGAGNEAPVYGNTTVNIGNAETVQMTTRLRDGENKPRPIAYQPEEDVLGANILGNVYGGGSLADVGQTHTVTENGATSDVIDLEANTFVNIGATKGVEILDNGQPTGRYNYNLVDLKTSAGVNYQGVTIGGNVFGGGKGEDAATMLFRCDKAMVTGSTNVGIGNGVVGTLDGEGKLVAGTGNVYGGGEVGRVEVNGSVTIGAVSGTGAPEIRGDVFGAGKGLNTHGYSALMRGNSYVTIQANAIVGRSVYGGGEVASVGRYNVAQTQADADAHHVEIGMPYSLASTTSGNCFVTVKGNAKIGPDDMTMPTFTGNVFGGGKGALPYEGYRTGEVHAGDTPWRMHPQNKPEEYGTGKETDYEKYIQTLGLATQTEVTIEGSAFVKGSVYGGSQNGIVQHNTHVIIQGNCQIGNGWDPTANSNAGGGVNRLYTTEEWAYDVTKTTPDPSLPECNHWPYEAPFAPYDKYAQADGTYTNGNSAGGGLPATGESGHRASDGHTYYGNVFGGGSGVEPYNPGLWHNKAGHVGGNTVVDIRGGHILTSVYGGNELTSVGGTCTVNFGGTATLGVPRTLQQIKDHPVTCYLFGAGKGDPRSSFDGYTNVGGTIVNISGGKIYGSVFGGAEDGHVLGDVTMTISGGTIGTWGTSYVDGNVFGGGRGYSGESLYAGAVTGNVGITISGGTMLGSIYGGGRLGSVGIGSDGEMITDATVVPAVLYTAEDHSHNDIPEGKKIGDVKTPAQGHGTIAINISGGTIGNSWEYKNVPSNITTAGALATWQEENNVSKSEYELVKDADEKDVYRLKHTKGGNVFAGGMGRIYGLDETTVLRNWVKMGKVKSTKLTITGGTIKSNVYGGGELGWTDGAHTDADGKEVSTEVIIKGGIIGTEVKDAGKNVLYTFGSVYGGGYGSILEELEDANHNKIYPRFVAGRVTGATKVDMQNGTVLASVYGGGEVANVGYGFYSYKNTTGEELRAPLNSSAAVDKVSTFVNISGGTIGKNRYGGATMGNVYGGGSGTRSIVRCGLVLGNTNVTVSGSPTIYHNIYGGGAYGTVGNFEYETENAQVTQNGTTITTVKVKGIEKLHTDDTNTAITGVANVTVTGGTIGTDGHNNGMVFGSSRGDVTDNQVRDDYEAWVYDTHVTIGGGTSSPSIAGSVYGSGENGHTFHDTDVQVHSGTIGLTEPQPADPDDAQGANYPYRGNVYGAGCGTDKYWEDANNDGVKDGNEEHYKELAGIVLGNATVTIDGGHVVHNVYGAGSMGSVGKVGTSTDTDESVRPVIHQAGNKTGITDHETFYDFGLSWPVKYVYLAYNPDDGLYKKYDSSTNNNPVSGVATVTVTGDAEIGVNGSTGGYVFGAASGAVEVGQTDITDQRYVEAKYANVRKTVVTIGTTIDPNDQDPPSQPTIHRSVYGGGEDGHVYEDTEVVINGGSIAHSVFGGGKGESTFNATLWNTASDVAERTPKDSPEPVHSWTAGRVYGNTNVTMYGGSVGYFIYGGGNLASVGKGSYSGGSDDYSTGGYGELPPKANQSLWTNTDFTESGITTVYIMGGTVGATGTGDPDKDSDDDGVLYGSVFGGSRGKAAASCRRSPRYHYVPDFFLGYVNKAHVYIGGKLKANGDIEVTADNPIIYGSVYGGGQDGHVRNSTEVKIYKGNIEGQGTYDTAGRSGNVFGAGSGIGKYMDNDVEKVNYSSGSVTCTTLVEVNGGTIARSVYGGGALASIGPPNTSQGDDEQKEATSEHPSCSHTQVNINGGSISGNVFGASRGPSDSFYEATFNNTSPYNTATYATTLYSGVNVTGGTVAGSVYGGGEGGLVKHDTYVSLGGDGVIDHDAYGGGKGTMNIEAHVGGDTKVELNKNEVSDPENLRKGCVVSRIFGANDFRGTPKGHVLVHVYATQRKGEGSVADKFPLREQGENEPLAAYLSRLIGYAKPNGALRTGVTTATITSAEEKIDEAETELSKTTAEITDDDLGELKAEFESAIAAVKQELDNLGETYDVQAVYGGGNLAAYLPKGPGATSSDDDYKHTSESTEVIIDGCSLSSIRQVYGGGNAASVPATSVTVNGCYEIDEVFGGGNGKDDYDIAGVHYKNPGANVGYETYSHFVKVGETGYVVATHGAGTEGNPYKAVENMDASTKEMRQEYYHYGSGEAKTEIYGGRIHVAYGGSNEKGNISSMVLSKYDDNAGCTLNVDETYGGGKNSLVDGDVEIDLGCVEYMAELYGGAKNADVNSNIHLNITNGTYGKVFGGNNTSGAIAGSITVNVKEQGCTPIIIGELYAGGYLAPYSVYGYEQEENGSYKVEKNEGIDQRIPFTTSSWETFKTTGVKIPVKNSLVALGLLASDATDAVIKTAVANAIDKDNVEIESTIATAIAGSDPDKKAYALQLKSIRNLIAAYPKADPRINIISATRIDNIFGGGYQALVVGNPHVNVNMEKGMIAAKYMTEDETAFLSDHTDTNITPNVTWHGERLKPVDVEGETKYDGILPIGTIGNIYGGGNRAAIYGDTFVEIGTGEWVNKQGQREMLGTYSTTVTTPTTFTYNTATEKWEYEKPITVTTTIDDVMPSPVDGATMQGTYSGVDVTISSSTTFTYSQSKWTYKPTEDSGPVALVGIPSPVDGATMQGTTATITTSTVFTYNSTKSKWEYQRPDTETTGITGVPVPARYTAKIDGDVFGGGNLGDVGHTYSETVGTTTSDIFKQYCNTYVTIGAKMESAILDDKNKPTGRYNYSALDMTNPGTITIEGNVYGGGKGQSTTFRCGDAMVTGCTNVTIGNGTLKHSVHPDGTETGFVYGGGQIGRVEQNTEVTIGLGDGVATGTPTSAPVIEGNVFGAGAGLNTHGYSALVRGSSTVTVQGNAKLQRSVYGGGEVASVGRYRVDDVTGLPVNLYDPKSSTSGHCFVTVKGYAEIGPDNMQMLKVDGNGDPLPPDDAGYVFGAGRGVLPFERITDPQGRPGRMLPNNTMAYYYDANPAKVCTPEYSTYVRTLALATLTDVKVEGHAFVKGGVYGGAENGFVQYDTHVTIDGNCQIGNGNLLVKDANGDIIINRGLNRRYTDDEWAADHLNATAADFTAAELAATSGLVDKVNTYYKTSLPECASWPYGIDTNGDGKKDVFAPYDRDAQTTSGNEEKYADGSTTNGGRIQGSDGHTFYGNVFGGGSGYFPYAPGKWFEFAGAVYRNTFLTIKGGHILTSVYGGNEMTDVGEYTVDHNEVRYVSGGTCYVTMTGGTLGVPRTLDQIAAHPVTCYLFGAGKGDQRVNFNESTDIGSAVIHVSDNARIYGSVFGGGEDGHVMENVKLSIGSTFPTLPTGDASKFTEEQKALLTIKSAYTDAEWSALTGTKAGTMEVTTVSFDETVTTETKDINYPLIGTTGTSYVDGNIFGAGRGFSGDALTAGSIGGNVEVNIAGGTMLGSIYGGGRLASVGIPFAYEASSDYGSFKEDTEAVLYTAADAEVIAGTKQVGDVKTPAKSYGHVTVNISGGTIGNPYEDIYLEGDAKTTADSWTPEEWKKWKAANKVSNTEFEVTENAYRATHTKGGNVYGGSMGRLEKLDGSINTHWWPQLGQVKSTTVNISGNNTLIKSCVFGGGELGSVRDNTTIVVGKTSKDDTGSPTRPTIVRDLYGGGYGSKDKDPASVGYVYSQETKSDNTTVDHIYRYTPLMWAGMVGKGTEVNIYDGWVKRNVYGGGEMASVGIINYEIENVTGQTTTAADLIDTQYKTGETWKYKAITKHPEDASGFALSWPYKTEYVGDYTGATHINVYGGRLGVDDDDNIWADNGDIYGGSKGMAGDRYDMAFCGNVGSSNILIDYPANNAATPENHNSKTADVYPYDCIVGAVYGGGEDGHVMGNTSVTLKNGLIGHSMYGGGSGKGKYAKTIKRLDTGKDYPTKIYSITAGKVYGNTHVRMENGYVGRFVYGGGNMGSVGKGNYAGGLDDYSYYIKPATDTSPAVTYNGYGEHLSGNLWDGVSDDSQAFLNTGKTEVEVIGGQVGYVASDPTKSMKDGLPYGCVFGGSRGESAPNITESPRYHYSPEFFSGYVNETNVTIGGYRCKEAYTDAGSTAHALGEMITAKEYQTSFTGDATKWEPTGPRILASVFGGGQDGHVRRDTKVTVDNGEIGFAYDKGLTPETGKTLNVTLLKTDDLDNDQWKHRGNVYGSGSGISKYKYDFNYDGRTTVDDNKDGKVDDTETTPQTSEYNKKEVKEEDYSTSAGSVTRFTEVNVNDGIIHRDVYGGGSNASVGAPKIPIDRTDDPLRRNDADASTQGKQSMCTVNIKGTIGTPNGYNPTVYGATGFKYNPVYGGEVYGACRGEKDAIKTAADSQKFATTVWTQVNILKGAHVLGNVFGGGDAGIVKKDTEVNVGKTTP